jgi:hypothetical protein
VTGPMADSNLSLQKKQKKNKSAYGNQPPGTVTWSLPGPRERN